MKIKVPIVPYLREIEFNQWLHAFIVARRYAEECETGGKIVKSDFISWMKKRGWTTRYKLWDRLIDSPFRNYHRKAETVYLKSVNKVAEYLAKQAIFSPDVMLKRGKYKIFAVECEVFDGMSLCEFKKWLTCKIASRPELRYSGKPCRQGEARIPLSSPGRSYAKISYETGISKRTAIRHLKNARRVKQTEIITLLGNENVSGLSPKFKQISKGFVEMRVQNSYAFDRGEKLWEILLNQNDGGLSFHKIRPVSLTKLFNKTLDNKHGWRLEPGDVEKRQLPATPYTIYLFNKERRNA